MKVWGSIRPGKYPSNNLPFTRVPFNRGVELEGRLNQGLGGGGVGGSQNQPSVIQTLGRADDMDCQALPSPGIPHPKPSKP